MSNGDVPRIFEPSRDLYEKAYSERDEARLYTMQLDKKIQSTQSKLHQKVESQDLHDLVAYRDDLLTKAHAGVRSQNYTDLHRFIVGAQFAFERACVPLLFGSNTKEAQRSRRAIADGMEAKSVDIMAEIFNEPELVNEIFSRHQNAHINESLRHFRGALQEDTVMALLNSPQDGTLIAIPSSLEEDIKQHTDMVVYYVSSEEGNNSYLFRVSVKSRAVDAEEEKEKYPHLVVVHPSNFNNQMFRISKLLVRKNEGHPGLTPDEEQEIADAIKALHAEISRQLTNGAGESLQPRNIKNLARLALKRLTA